MKITPILLLSGSAFLASCGLSEKQCAQGDWAAIGVKDGKNGRGTDFVENHLKSCAKHGIDVETLIWEQGRQEGLKTYCTPQSAYIQGRNGHVLSDVCPTADKTELSLAHEKGRKYYLIQQEIRELLNDRDNIRSEISRLQSMPANPEIISEIQSLRSDILRLELDINLLDARKIRYSQL